MENKQFVTIRELARTKIFPEHAIRLFVKQKKLPAVFVGAKALLPLEKTVEILNELANCNLESKKD